MSNVIHIGVSPAGVEWNVYPKTGETPAQVATRVATQTARLQLLKARHGVMPVRTLSELQADYKAARSALYKRAARMRKKGGHASVMDDAHYESLRVKCQRLNKAIKDAKKA